MRPVRCVLIGLIAAALAPGLWWQTPTPTPAGPTAITVTPIAEYEGIASTLPIAGAWEIRAEHPFFGGFSAMVADRGNLLVGSDRGWMMRLPLINGAPRDGAVTFVDYARAQDPNLDMIDLEAMALDPETGMLWTAYESANAIRREDRRRSRSVLRQPPEMAQWSHNSGPETMVRLDDGRFIVIAEGKGDDRVHPALLFAEDPIMDRSPTPFGFASPREYAPVDATALPDGTVLIALRRVRYGFPAKFDAALMVADPGRIARGRSWTGKVIARFEGELFGENFEGLAYVPNASGRSGSIYIVSDDNLSMFQRTLLVRLEWPGGSGDP